MAETSAPNIHVANRTADRLLQEICGLDLLELSHADCAGQLAERLQTVGQSLETLHRARMAGAKDSSWDLDEELLDEMHEGGGIGKGQIGDGSLSPIVLSRFDPPSR